MKNKKLNIGILFIALALVLYFTLKDDFNGIIKELSSVNIWIFLMAIIVFLASLLFKSASLKTFICEHNSCYTLKNAYQLTLIGQFLNGITPFQSGGQPFQIYLLKKDGIRISDSTNAMIKDFIAYQSALIIVGTASLLLNLKLNLFSNNVYLNGFIFLGFFINLVVMALLLFVVLAKKAGISIANKIVHFIFKFKVIRKFGTTEEKIKESIKNFYKTGASIKGNKKNLIKGIIYNIINLTLLYLVPFVVFKALGVKNINVISSIVATSFVMLISNFIPVPGATGGIEYSFMQFFKGFTGGAVLAGVMLLWRFITYFMAMITGFIALMFKRRVDKDENRIIH